MELFIAMNFKALAVFLLHQTNAFRDAGKAIYTLEIHILTVH